jgi:hypothetical protein
MKSHHVVMLLAVASVAMTSQGHAQGVYKCGRTYQQAPCTGSGQELRIHSDSASHFSDTPMLKVRSTVHTSAKEAAEIFKSQRHLVLDKLKDPDSAKFQGVKVFQFMALDQMQTMICGTLNAKNSYGGYTGSKLFTVINGFARIDDNGGRQLFNGRWFNPMDAILACEAKGTTAS